MWQEAQSGEVPLKTWFLWHWSQASVRCCEFSAKPVREAWSQLTWLHDVGRWHCSHWFPRLVLYLSSWRRIQ